MKLRQVLVCGGLMLAGQMTALAARLPLRQYTTREGLSHDRVVQILSDSRGFLWFTHPHTLSQFDGHSFVTHGMDREFSRDIVEDPNGFYWVSSGGQGVFRIDPHTADPEAVYMRYPVGGSLETNRAHCVLYDRSGKLWTGTRNGLFVRDAGDETAPFQPVDLHLAPEQGALRFILTLLEDRHGSLWIGTGGGLLRRSADGRVAIVPLAPEGTAINVTTLLEDDEGRIWAGHRQGLTVLRPSEGPIGPDGAIRGVRFMAPGAEPPDGVVRMPTTAGETRFFSAADGSGLHHVTAILRTTDGRIWFAAFAGWLTEFDGRRFDVLSPDDGIPPFINTLGEDREGNLWIGTATTGVTRLARNGFKSYSQEDGLPEGTQALFTGASPGEPSIFAAGKLWTLEDSRFQPVPLNVDGRRASAVLRDRQDAWWIATDGGLLRFAAVASAGRLAASRPAAVYTEADGLPASAVTAVCEDSAGDIWVSSGPSMELARWSRSNGRIERLTGPQGRPLTGALTACVSDRSGSVWLGLGGRLLRLREGRVTDFSEAASLPSVPLIDLHMDAGGRLWAACLREGVVRIDEPEADRPRLVRYGRAEGLSSPHIRTLAEDSLGRLYFGSPTGVDRLDPETGRVRSFTTADGLGNNEVVDSIRDGEGALWFATREGLSVLVPRADTLDAPPPPVRLVAVNAAGARVPVPLAGTAALAGLELSAPRSDVVIEYAGLSFGLGGNLRFQYRLGGGDAAWSAPTPLRAVNYANLAPGRYRFEVRAVDAEGAVSPEPAAVSLEVLPPIWRRWWFLSLMGLALAGAGLAVAQYRRKRTLELERVRRGIARDLHDDVGSSLSRIAILSEVARRETRRDPDSAAELNERIAGAAREMVDNLSDIVWAIDPHKDHVGDVVQRVRRFAEDLFGAGEVEFRFESADDARSLGIDRDIRREIFLVMKEAINNVARHSRCTMVDLSLRVNGDALQIVIRDDGIGFDPASASGGNGLASMTERAERFGGRLEIDSRPGAGTTLRFEFPRKLSPRALAPAGARARRYPDG